NQPHRRVANESNKDKRIICRVGQGAAARSAGGCTLADSRVVANGFVVNGRSGAPLWTVEDGRSSRMGKATRQGCQAWLCSNGTRYKQGAACGPFLNCVEGEVDRSFRFAS